MNLLQKTKQLRIATIFTVIIILSGCTGNDTTPVPLQATITNQPVQPINTVEMLPTATLTTTPEPTPTEEFQLASELTSYAFVAVLDYNKHTLDVEESIQYHNTSEGELSEIRLVVPPNKTAEVFTLTELTITEGPALAEYSLDGITLSMKMAEPLQVGGVSKMTIKYKLNLPYQGGILGYSKKQANLSDWYPFVAPYDAVRGWIINQPAELGEYLMYDKANFEMTIALTGADGLVVAGSTEVIMLDINIYKMTAMNSRGLAFSVSNQYQTLAQQFGSTTVNAYYFAGHEVAAQAAMKNSGDALLLFSTLFEVPYPHNTMAVVEADFPDGMEYDGLYYLSQSYYAYMTTLVNRISR